MQQRLYFEDQPNSRHLGPLEWSLRVSAARAAAPAWWARRQRSQHGDQEDQEQYRGRMGTWTDQKYLTPATT
ncbi:hypothetical protein EMCRGX_G014754 [Ephydatia muelleri]